MRALIADIAFLFRTVWSFRLALLYLGLLTLLVFLLPLIPLPHTANDLNLQHVFLKPFTNTRHPLGTDQLGRDVLANLLHGARNGLFIAVPVMLVATIAGTLTGAIAGYFGNKKWKQSLAKLLLGGCSLFIGFYYFIYLPLAAANYKAATQVTFSAAIVGVLLLLILWAFIYRLLKRLRLLQVKISVPLDSLILRLIELLNSIPRIMLLISIAAFISPSVTLLSVIFICTYWTTPARLARAEMLRIIKLPYLEAAISTGMKHHRIIIHQTIPNLLTPVVVSFVFGVASLLTIESTLSFLGIGLPATFASWGRMITGIRANLSAWWLIVFPGGFLALTVLALQTCSYHLLQIWQQKSQ